VPVVRAGAEPELPLRRYLAAPASGLDAGDNRLLLFAFSLVDSIGTDGPPTRVMGRICDGVQLAGRPKRPGRLSKGPGDARNP